MPRVVIALHRFAQMEDAAKTADDIRNSGSVTYNDASGSTVNVTVDDVTIEGDATKTE